jgi:drug/metabolite transporter (DMT)-like permease
MDILKSSLSGIRWMLLQCVIFSGLSLATQMLATSVPIFVIFCLGNLVVLVSMVPWIIRSTTNNLSTSVATFYFFRAITGTAGLCTWFYALKLVPITEATAISYTTPLFTCILAVLILKERIRSHHILALIVGFIGAMIILRPGNEMAAGIGMMLALLSSLLWAICDIIIKHQLRTDDYNTQIFYMTAMMVLVSLPLALWQWQPLTIEQWVSIIGIGVLFLLNFHALFRAYYHANLTVVMPFDFSRLIFTGIAAYFLFGEQLDGWTIIGSAVIMSSTVYISYREKLLT